MPGGVVTPLGLTMLVSGRRVLEVLLGLRRWRVWSMAFHTVGGLIIFLPVILGLVDHFLEKLASADVDGLADAYNTSRGGLMQPMLTSIRDYPFEGIRFGIGSGPMRMEVRDPIMGLPLSAAVEKGVMPLAILEQIGMFGLLLVLIWVFRLLVVVATRCGVVPLAVCVTALRGNLGEGSMFSPDGQELLIMMLLGWSHPCAAQASHG